jgi:hypothetical protein
MKFGPKADARPTPEFEADECGVQEGAVWALIVKPLSPKVIDNQLKPRVCFGQLFNIRAICVHIHSSIGVDQEVVDVCPGINDLDL